MSTHITFTVYGTEFCRALSTIALFQGSPRDWGVDAAVRLLVTTEGLYLAATNGISAAIAHIDTEHGTGVGPFSIPHAQVKAVLAIFDRKLPKDIDAQQYQLEVTVTEETISITDVSVLFDGDSFTMALPSPDSIEYGDQTSTDRAMNVFTRVTSGLDDDAPVPFDSGIYFSPAQVGLLARAAKAWGFELHLRTAGRRLIAPIAEDLTAFTVGTTRDPKIDTRPYLDERALAGWRDRLHEVVDKGVLAA